MRRRTGFTLVEVLVAMALILFIMTILGAAFSAATQTVSDLKSAGDLAERLRGAATVIKRDLEADHCFDGQGNVLPVRTVFGTSLNPNQPPAQGFFRIYEGQSTIPALVAGAPAGDELPPDINGFHSYYQTTASLAYTISLNGTRRDDFLSAFVPGSPLTTDPTLGPPDQRYEDTWSPGTTIPTVYNSPSAEVALFLVRTNDVTDASGSGALPLYGLYRRQLLTVPPTAPRGATPPAPWVPNPPVPSAQAPNYVEVSTFPSGGNLAFNRLADLTMPVRRFWMSGPAGAAYQAGGRYATMGESNPNYVAADLLMPDVISMDVRVLVLGNSDFLDLFDPGVQQYAGGNPAFTGNGPRVFDTWSSQNDALSGVSYGPTAWMTPGSQMSIPLYKSAGPNPQMISVQAIQITLRVWDFKTKKTRQVTIVQQM